MKAQVRKEVSANQEVKTQSNHEGMKKYITHAYFEVLLYIVIPKADPFLVSSISHYTR